ncbi:hypothetical protein PN441_17200 [Spirulina major CS-329]|nr:hypothetical protein [Spirulina major CS-329]
MLKSGSVRPQAPHPSQDLRFLAAIAILNPIGTGKPDNPPPMPVPEPAIAILNPIETGKGLKPLVSQG